MQGNYVCKLNPVPGRKEPVYLKFDPFSGVENIDDATAFSTKAQVHKAYLSVHRFPEDYEKDITDGHVVAEQITQPQLEF